jgi:hypothetical protein
MSARTKNSARQFYYKAGGQEIGGGERVDFNGGKGYIEKD